MKNKSLILLVASATIFGLASCAPSSSTSSEETSSAIASSEIGSSEVISSELESSEESSSSVSYDPNLTGAGTEDDPYMIANKEQLKTFASSDKSAYYKLACDINFEGEEWTAVGLSKNDTFKGSFDGDGHTISNLKITTYDANTMYYGFFGYTNLATIKNLTLDAMTIDLTISGNGSTTIIGGVTALGKNTTVTNVAVNYETYHVQTKDSGESYIYAGGIYGYVGALSDNDTTYFVKCEGSSVTGDVNVDIAKTANAYSYVGGIAGDVYTGHGDGIFAIANDYVNGNVTGGTFVGGITGYLDTYGSISYCYVKGTSVKATDGNGAYAGGLVSYAYVDSAIQNSYADLTSVEASYSVGSYASYACGLVAIYTSDGYAYGYGMDGCQIYNTYAKAGITATADKAYSCNTILPDDNTYKKTLGFTTSIWNLQTTSPTIKRDYTLGDVTVDFNVNGGTEVESITVGAGRFNSTLATAGYYGTNAKAGYSFDNYCYDQAGEANYRWYVPVYKNTTLYANFVDVSELVGTYNYVCEYEGNTVGTGYWKVTDTNFYWVSGDNTVLTYTYKFNGSYLILSGVKTSSGTIPGYDNEIVALNEEGQLQCADINDEDAIYTGTKSEAEVVIPNYKDEAFLGTWYSTKGVILGLYDDGDATAYTTTSTVLYYGGYRVNSGVLKVNVFGKISGEYTYDADNDAYVGENDLIIRTAIDEIFTADDSLYLVVSGDKYYAVKNGAIVATSITGTLADNEEITIAGTKYTVSGASLTKVAEETPSEDPADPVEENENTYVGTWTGTCGQNPITIILSDTRIKYGDYDEKDLTITGDLTELSVHLTSDIRVELNYDSEKQTLTGKYIDDWEEYNLDITCTTYAPFAEEDEEENSDGVYGTYTGTWGYYSQTACTIVLNEDGTGALKNSSGDVVTFNFTVGDNGKLSISGEDYINSAFDDLTLTYNAEKNQLTGTICEDYEYDYTITVTK